MKEVEEGDEEGNKFVGVWEEFCKCFVEEVGKG